MPTIENPVGSPPRIVPTEIQCFQHGGMCPVHAQRYVTHIDNTRHVYAFARCGIGGGPHHEFGEWVSEIEAKTP